MRTFDEIQADITAATNIHDLPALTALAEEMQALASPVANAVAFNTLGIVDLSTGNILSGKERFAHALAEYEKLGNRSGVAGVICNLGIVYYSTGEYPAALEYYSRALSLYEDLGDRAGMARACGSVGNVYYSTGDYPLAMKHYRRTLALFEEIGSRLGAARAEASLGILYYCIGDNETALEHYQKARSVLDELGGRATVASIIGNMGNLYAETDDYVRALEYYGQALALYEEFGDVDGVVHITGSMIVTLLTHDRFTEAAELLDRQATMQIEHPDAKARRMSNLAILAEHHEDLDAAQRHLTEALAITTEAGMRTASLEYHQKLRDLAQRRNDFAGFIEHNAEFLRISEEVRGKESIQKLAMMEAERNSEAERREHEKHRALLYSALPKSIADRMIRGEDVTGDYFNDAAVMFLDIAGFTSHTSDMPPAFVVKMLENMFTTIDGICDKYDVVKIKTIGDSYMCFRGDGNATTNASSIANVALDAMKEVFTWLNGESVRFRIGLHIGPATAGVIGTQRLQYDVWGDTVNVASRMESTGEAGRIHVSQAFAENLEEESRINNQESNRESTQHMIKHRGEIDVKGKGMMKTYWLENTST